MDKNINEKYILEKAIINCDEKIAKVKLTKIRAKKRLEEISTTDSQKSIIEMAKQLSAFCVNTSCAKCPFDHDNFCRINNLSHKWEVKDW